MLTRTASYRGTVCEFKEREPHLLRTLRGEPDPAAMVAREQVAALDRALADLVPRLDERDLEILVDLIFSQGGWRRLSALGEDERDLDLLLENPINGERAWVQVKSSANQAVLDDYLARFHRHGNAHRFYFICHSPQGGLTGPDQPAAHLWTREMLARQANAAGLADWLIARTG